MFKKITHVLLYGTEIASLFMIFYLYALDYIPEYFLFQALPFAIIVAGSVIAIAIYERGNN